MALTLKYRAEQEHLVRRLGQAVVLHWDEFSDDLQDLLIDQAAVVDDPSDAPHSDAEFEDFIRTVKTTALKD